MNEPEILPDYHASPWLCYGERTGLPDDPESPALFAQALTFLESITDQFNEAGPWPQLPDVEFLQALQQHNHQAQAKGDLPKGIEVTLRHVKALSQRRLLAFEETGWHLTHYEHLVRYLDQRIAQAVTGNEEEKQLTKPASSCMAPADIHLLVDTTLPGKDLPPRP